MRKSEQKNRKTLVGKERGKWRMMEWTGADGEEGVKVRCIEGKGNRGAFIVYGHWRGKEKEIERF